MVTIPGGSIRFLRTSKASGGEVLSWALYDFANSAFATTILAVIFNRYYAGVVAGGAEGVSLAIFGQERTIHGAAMFNFIVTIAMFLVAVSSPILGAWADSLAAKKRFLSAYILLGVLSTAMLSQAGPGTWLSSGIWFILANFAFAGGNVFYNAFLRDIASPDEMGRISGWGWGIGYLGGGTLLLLNLLMLQAPHLLGFPPDTFTVHHTFMTVSVWWALFSIPLLVKVKERVPVEKLSMVEGAVDSFRRLGHTFRNIRRYRQLWRFLVAYLFFNDGIETVIIMAAVFGDQVLGMSQELLIGYFLLIQFTAFFGSLLFGRISNAIGTLRALRVTLIIWCIVVISAFFVGWTGYPIPEYFVLGIIAGIVMGASQSLARALQGTFTPVGQEAEFFGFFAVSGRFAAILGPLTYGAVVALTGSLRIAILTLILFFVTGMILLTRVDEKEGREIALAEGLE
ncbi:MFS transporter [bacterium]|nr:MFS transporter [bacterium]